MGSQVRTSVANTSQQSAYFCDADANTTRIYLCTACRHFVRSPALGQKKQRKRLDGQGYIAQRRISRYVDTLQRRATSFTFVSKPLTRLRITSTHAEAPTPLHVMWNKLFFFGLQVRSCSLNTSDLSLFIDHNLLPEKNIRPIVRILLDKFRQFPPFHGELRVRTITEYYSVGCPMVGALLYGSSRFIRVRS